MKYPAHSPLDVLALPPPVRGAGVFLSSGDVARLGRDVQPLDELGDIVDTGLRWAAIWVESFDGRRASLVTVQRVAERLRRHEVVPALWSFPAPSSAARAAAHLGMVATAIRSPLAILDIEDPDGKSGPMDWEPVDARGLVDVTIDSITEHTMIGVTSYPGRAGHGLPWGELVVGVGMPQIYGTADSPARARAAVESWLNAHSACVPITSLRSPGAQSANIPPAQLAKRLDAIAIELVDAAGLWSWALMRASAAHRRAVAGWIAARGW